MVLAKWSMPSLEVASNTKPFYKLESTSTIVSIGLRELCTKKHRGKHHLCPPNSWQHSATFPTQAVFVIDPFSTIFHLFLVKFFHKGPLEWLLEKYDFLLLYIQLTMLLHSCNSKSWYKFPLPSLLLGFRLGNLFGHN